MHALPEPLRNAIDLAWLDLFHASWQSAVAGTVVLALVFAGKRWPASLRYALLTVALFKFVVPPFLTAPSGVFSHWGPAVALSQITPRSVATDDKTAMAVPPRTERIRRVSAANESAGRSRNLNLRGPRSSSRGPRPQGPARRWPKVVSECRKRDFHPVPNTDLATVVRPSAVASGLMNGRFVALLAWLIGAVLAIVWLLDQQRQLRPNSTPSAADHRRVHPPTIERTVDRAAAETAAAPAVQRFVHGSLRLRLDRAHGCRAGRIDRPASARAA